MQSRGSLHPSSLGVGLIFSKPLRNLRDQQYEERNEQQGLNEQENRQSNALAGKQS